MSPLLITSVVKTYATDSNLLKDEEQRLEQTRDAIFNIVKKQLFSEIVIVDGSNTKIFNDDEIKKFISNGVIVEQICFQQIAEDVRVGGKSQGELQIIYHAIENSNLINLSGGFFKISGRYSIKNISCILRSIGAHDNVFYFDNPPSIGLGGRFVATIFYKTQNDFFLKHFGDASAECGYHKDGFLEAIFYRRLVKLKKNRCFVPFPRYEGVSGTTGKPLVNRYYLVRNLISRIGGLCYVY
jgi:hypothetical protein